jgi:hypothetical protein
VLYPFAGRSRPAIFIALKPGAEQFENGSFNF